MKSTILLIAIFVAVYVNHISFVASVQIFPCDNDQDVVYKAQHLTSFIVPIVLVENMRKNFLGDEKILQEANNYYDPLGVASLLVIPADECVVTASYLNGIKPVSKEYPVMFVVKNGRLMSEKWFGFTYNSVASSYNRANRWKPEKLGIRTFDVVIQSAISDNRSAAGRDAQRNQRPPAQAQIYPPPPATLVWPLHLPAAPQSVGHMSGGEPSNRLGYPARNGPIDGRTVGHWIGQPVGPRARPQTTAAAAGQTNPFPYRQEDFPPRTTRPTLDLLRDMERSPWNAQSSYASDSDSLAPGRRSAVEFHDFLGANDSNKRPRTDRDDPAGQPPIGFHDFLGVNKRRRTSGQDYSEFVVSSISDSS